jgi:hypothetical protein
MENIITIVELILFASGLSLIINAIHICFQEGMFLEWLYKLLESKFRAKKLKDLNWQISIDMKENGSFISYNCGDFYKTEIYDEDKLKEKYYWGIGYEGRLNSNFMANAKWRNSEGLLYIAKPIYACASCMPSIWSLPLLFILVWWKVLIISIFAIVISTILRDKIFE